MRWWRARPRRRASWPPSDNRLDSDREALIGELRKEREDNQRRAEEALAAEEALFGTGQLGRLKPALNPIPFALSLSKGCPFLLGL